jgi:ribosomal protein S18 acetylase RimI-like enzyme
MRPYEAADEGEVLGLINANRIPGQPRVSAAMLASALSGRSPIDSSFWSELGDIATMIMRDPSDHLLGVISFAIRPRDDAGVILWLYAKDEAEMITRDLIGPALAALGRRTVLAFDFASALTLGLEALPARHRATTHRALELAGFVGRDDWRYIHRRLDSAWPISTSPEVDVFPSSDRAGWELMMRAPDGTLIGEATIGEPVDGIGALWWISIEPAFRGGGLGRGLLGQCLSRLVAEGAREVIAFVDDDAPPGDPERDRTPANRLYDSMGFRELDRLWSFTRHP